MQTLNRAAEENALSGFLRFRPATLHNALSASESAALWWRLFMWSAGLGFRPPRRYLRSQGRQARESVKWAHSCRWRFPARPGGSCNSGTGRRAGRIRVTASLRSVSGGAHPNAAGLGPGFDAALQVSSVIGSNLQKFRDVLGESSDSSSGEVSTGQDQGPARR